MVKVLCIGDVVGNRSCEYLRTVLPGLKRKYKADITIVNGENSADGNGITPFSAKHLFSSGADVITGGNHTVKRKEIFEMLESDPFMTRPANMKFVDFGKGMIIFDLGRCSVAVINLCGTVYMDDAESPFFAAEDLIAEADRQGAVIKIVDFHAEATSEKRALGQYLDGKVSALFGTHTHVQTSDIEILPHGTGYVTDIGMCGPKDSVLGIESSIVINRFMGNTSERFRVSENEIMLCGCVFGIDEKSGKCISCEAVSI